MQLLLLEHGTCYTVHAYIADVAIKARVQSCCCHDDANSWEVNLMSFIPQYVAQHSSVWGSTPLRVKMEIQKTAQIAMLGLLPTGANIRIDT